MPRCRNMTLHHAGRKQEIEQMRRMPTDKAMRHVSASPTETIGPHRRATHSDQSVPGLGDPRSGQVILSAAYVERRSGEEDQADFTVYEAKVGHYLIFARSKAEIIAPYGWEYVTKKCASSARCLSLGDSQNKS